MYICICNALTISSTQQGANIRIFINIRNTCQHSAAPCQSRGILNCTALCTNRRTRPSIRSRTLSHPLAPPRRSLLLSSLLSGKGLHLIHSSKLSLHSSKQSSKHVFDAPRAHNLPHCVTFPISQRSLWIAAESILQRFASELLLRYINICSSLYIFFLTLPCLYVHKRLLSHNGPLLCIQSPAQLSTHERNTDTSTASTNYTKLALHRIPVQSLRPHWNNYRSSAHLLFTHTSTATHATSPRAIHTSPSTSPLVRTSNR